MPEPEAEAEPGEDLVIRVPPAAADATATQNADEEQADGLD